MDVESLIAQIRNLMASPVAKQVEDRVREFRILHLRGNKEWFAELCFCILTANSSARLGMRIQEEIGLEGFLVFSEEELAGRLTQLGHRFSERRARFIVQAREFSQIKEIVASIEDEKLAREWLVKNVMGLGYKEASHFLRNVGYDNLAILDRHVLRIMYEHGLIEEIPKGLTRRKYLELETKLHDLGAKIGIPLSKLDLYLWCMKTGAVLK